MRRFLAALSVIAALLIGALPAVAAGYNGTGSITRPNNTTSYGSGAVTKLLAGNTSGNASPISIAISGTSFNGNYIVGARLRTTGTGASGAAFKVYLYSSAPTLTGLSDGSTYVGPYAADLPNFIGVLTCGSMTATNDGTAQYWSECSTGNLVTGPIRFTGSGSGTTTTIYGVIEVTTGYTPIANEVETIDLATGF